MSDKNYEYIADIMIHKAESIYGGKNMVLEDISFIVSSLEVDDY